MVPVFVILFACSIQADGAHASQPGKYAAVNVDHIVVIADPKQAGGETCVNVMTTAGRRYVVGSVEDIVKAIEEAYITAKERPRLRGNSRGPK